MKVRNGRQVSFLSLGTGPSRLNDSSQIFSFPLSGKMPLINSTDCHKLSRQSRSYFPSSGIVGLSVVLLNVWDLITNSVPHVNG